MSVWFVVKNAAGRSWKHLTDWSEAYLWVPLVLCSIWLSGKLVELWTHHPAKENIDWLVDYQAVAYKCVWIIVFTSIFKQATGTWLSKQEKFDHPVAAFIGDVKILLSFLAFVWLFTH